LVREFTVAVFVVCGGKVLLHRHRKLRRWLPPGGHVESGETPDDAAIRETREETGLEVELLDATAGDSRVPAAPPDERPRRLTQPLGIQLEDIAPGHQHIDLVYAARVRLGAATSPRAAPDAVETHPAWFGPDEWPKLAVTDEVQRWGRAAIACAANLV
jgi:ADP-ribose pyrophosphatase YjhB (NUDIX family)